jgi:hypothetical protein
VTRVLSEEGDHKGDEHHQKRVQQLCPHGEDLTGIADKFGTALI